MTHRGMPGPQAGPAGDPGGCGSCVAAASTTPQLLHPRGWPPLKALRLPPAAAEPHCRVCSTGPCYDDDLVAPCSCSGEQRWVHSRCLEGWRAKSVSSCAPQLPPAPAHALAAACCAPRLLRASPAARSLGCLAAHALSS